MTVRLLAVAGTGLLAAVAAARLLPPARRLGPRLQPYLLGLAPGAALPRSWRSGPSRPADRDEGLALRLWQAGFLPSGSVAERLAAYRRGLWRAAVSGAGLGALLGVAGGVAAAGVLALAVLGGLAGAGRTAGRLDQVITARRERMRIELGTVNQLLALHVRVGGGVTQALQQVVARGSGAVVEELEAVLRRHRGGRPIAVALDEAARRTPEPHAARTYRLLARGADLGADLAHGLRALSEDLRQERREALVRLATRRRAAMLVPIIGLLAPVMLVFVAAPLPSIVFGS